MAQSGKPSGARNEFSCEGVIATACIFRGGNTKPLPVLQRERGCAASRPLALTNRAGWRQRGARGLCPQRFPGICYSPGQN